MPFLSLSNFIFHPLAEYQRSTLLSVCIVTLLPLQSRYSVSGERVQWKLAGPIYSPLVALGHVIVTISDD